jgi:vitamin B12 transporter
LNVMSGVDGQDTTRSSGLQAFARYDISPSTSISARLWGSDDFVQLNNSPSTDGIPDANIPATGIISGIPLSTAARNAYLAGGTPVFGQSTFVQGINDPDDRRSSRFWNSAFIFRNTPSSIFSWQASYQRVYTDRVYENGPLGVGFQPLALSYGDYRGTIHTADIRGMLQIGSWLSVSGGYEWERENYFDHQDNNAPADQRVIERTHATQDSQSGYFAAQITALERKLQIGLSGRAQFFNLSRPSFIYGGADNPYVNLPGNVPRSLTGDASIAYLLTHANTKLRAHIGNAFRAPSLYERFGAGFSTDFFTGDIVFTPYGDPRLSPDRYNSFDAGVDQYLFSNRLRVSATWFYTRVVQVTAFDFSGFVNPATDPYGRTAGYINGSGGISRGAEVGVELRPVRSLSVSGSYTYTNANLDRDLTVPGVYQVFQSPRHIATLVATKQWGSRFDSTVQVVRYSSILQSLFAGFESRAFEFPGFTKTDLVLNYRFWQDDRKVARIYGKADNLFDRTYFPTGYINPGATGIVGIGYSF